MPDHAKTATDMNTKIPAWINGTLVPAPKLEVHQRGLRHKAVSVFVMRAEQVLIQRRALGKYHTPGLWANTCCTHPHWDEDPQTCAQRRLSEELGITGLTLTFRDQVEYRADVGGDMIEHEVVDIFVAEAPKDMTLALNADEVMQTDWVTLNELRAMIDARPMDFTPWLKIYLTDHATRIFGGAG